MCVVLRKIDFSDLMIFLKGPKEAIMTNFNSCFLHRIPMRSH